MFITAAFNIGMYQPVTVKYLIRNQSRHLVAGDGGGKYLASPLTSQHKFMCPTLSDSTRLETIKLIINIPDFDNLVIS